MIPTLTGQGANRTTRRPVRRGHVVRVVDLNGNTAEHGFGGETGPPWRSAESP
jgi:hypothetical protein